MRITLGQPGGFDTIIDARSEDEYALDHLPHAVNWPSLNNTERITVGTMYKQLGGFEAVVGTPVGAFSATMSASKIANLGSGWAATMAYQGLFRRAQGQADSLNIMVETRSRDFAPISIILPSNPFQYELSGSFSHPLNDRAFISVDGRFSKARLGFVDQHYYRLSGGLRVNDRISLTAETRYEHNAFRAQVSGLLSVNVRLGRASSARADYESVNHRTRASYQTLSGQGVGSFNLSGDIERNDLSGDLNLNGNYDSNFGDVGFSHIGVFSKDFDQSQSQRTTLRGSTSIAFADGSVAIGRPIFDSFAIVKAHPSLAGKTVRVDPSGTGYAATTSGFGAALYPTLNSYSERTITVEAPEAPAGTDLGTGLNGLGQLGLEQIGEGRGVLGGHTVAGPAVDQGAEQGRGAAGTVGQMLDQVGGGGFAVGAGDPDQGKASTGLGPERGRQKARPARQGFGTDQHRIAGTRRLGRRGRRSDHGRHSAGLQRLGPEATPIHLGPRQPHKQGAPAHPPRIAADAAHLPIGQPVRRLQTHVPQDRMEQLGHGTRWLNGAFLSVLARKTVLLQPNPQALPRQAWGHPRQHLFPLG